VQHPFELTLGAGCCRRALNPASGDAPPRAVVHCCGASPGPRRGPRDADECGCTSSRKARRLIRGWSHPVTWARVRRTLMPATPYATEGVSQNAPLSRL